MTRSAPSVPDQIHQLLAEQLADLSVEQMQYRLPEHWTIQQIAEHLHLTYRSTETLIASRLEKGRGTLSRPSLRQQLAQTVVCRFRLFPGRRKAPSPVDPGDNLVPCCGKEMLSAAAEALVRMEEVLARAEIMFGTRLPIASHTVLGPLAAWQWRHFHLVHGRHHLKQIQAIRKRNRL
jgi:hypothetical protein